MPSALVEALIEWKKRCPDSPHRLVFPNWKGNIESLSNIWNRCFAPLQVALNMVDENGRSRFSFHTLRHFRATVLIASGENMVALKNQMGHASAVTTLDIYGHLFAMDEDDACETANRLVSEFVPEKRNGFDATRLTTAAIDGGEL
jgi:integrase